MTFGGLPKRLSKETKSSSFVMTIAFFVLEKANISSSSE
ncbi:hypothetical protein CLV60_12532 [Dyadobacter jiangsuensis]|uniref:Uncharacterized protein n=1 Tax=Dyadobacter jiangsuensis TaxID=1591085 RepID=A0A2P8FDR1_9BACT|nr:hypothetical protein CLV60_12532 [Dyadobacter jiangsuensis]